MSAAADTMRHGATGSAGPDFAAIARTYRDALPRDDVTFHAIDALDRTGVPVAQANLIRPGKIVTTGHGYGLTADEAAVGALGELCEEALCGVRLAHQEQIVASHAELVRLHGPDSIVDPLTLCLPAGSDYDEERPLSWMRATRWPDDATMLVPADWVAAHDYQLGHAPELVLPITNGLGAGLSLEHAIGHGVMELLQRDGNATAYRALDQGVVVELDTVADPDTRAVLARLEALGIEVMVKLASVEFGIANLYVVGRDRGAPAIALQATACGEAAHPDRERALRKALLEYCGSRARKAATHGAPALLARAFDAAHIERQRAAAQPDAEEPRALAAMVEWLDQDADTLTARLASTVFAERTRVRFSDLPGVASIDVADPRRRLRLLADRLGAAGHPVLFVDCSPADGPVHAVKVVVPGLEAETMSYGRIGWRGVRRLRDRGDPLLHDAPTEGARPVRLRPDDEARAGGPAWFDVARARDIVGALYPLYREPGCFSAQLRRADRPSRTAPRPPADEDIAS